MIEVDAKVTISEDGRIWINSLGAMKKGGSPGQCVIRIQGVDPKQVRLLVEQDKFIDLRITKEGAEETIFVVCANDYPVAAFRDENYARSYAKEENRRQKLNKITYNATPRYHHINVVKLKDK